MDLLVVSAHAKLLDVLVVWNMNASIVCLDTGLFHVDKKLDCVLGAAIIQNSYLAQETVMSHTFSVHIVKLTCVWLLDETVTANTTYLQIIVRNNA